MKYPSSPHPKSAACPVPASTNSSPRAPRRELGFGDQMVIDQGGMWQERPILLVNPDSGAEGGTRTPTVLLPPAPQDDTSRGAGQKHGAIAQYQRLGHVQR